MKNGERYFPPPFVDVNLSNGVILRWYRLMADLFDLYPEPCGELEVGDTPSWLEWDSLPDILDDVFNTYERGRHRGEEFHEGWILWALRNGITPGIPFCVELDEPVFYACGVYGEETDVEYQGRVRRVLPTTAKQRLGRWSGILTWMRKYRNARCDKLEAIRELQELDGSALTIVRVKYPVGYSNFPCQGLHVTLCSSHTLGHQVTAPLVSVKEDSGDGDKALSSLLAVCRQKYPRMDPKAVIKAYGSHRRVCKTLTRIDRILQDDPP